MNEPGGRMDWQLTARQIVGTCRLELRRALFSPRSLALYFLAAAPLLLVGVWTFTPFPAEQFQGRTRRRGCSL